MANHHRSTNLVATLLLLVLLAPIVIPFGAAQSHYDEDGWLVQDWFTRDGRIAAGDELGCNGMPGMDLALDTRATAESCKQYLMSRTNASRWAAEPLAFGVDIEQNPRFTSADHSILREVGFAVHGHDTGFAGTAWHGATDAPETESDWWNLGRSGSLESSVSPVEDIQAIATAGGMVNLYWEAQIADLKVRTNGELVDWLESSQAWYTTWGEAYSYDYHRNSDSVHLDQQNETSWKLANDGPNIDDGAIDQLAWNVPVTRGLDVRNNSVLSVQLGNESLPQLSLDSKVLQSGWRQQDGILWLSLKAGENVTISLQNESVIDMHPSQCGNLETIEECIAQRRPRFFNNHSWALTIAGYHATDLFKWSMKFDESPLLFTWLIEPAPIEGFNWILVVLAGAVGLGSVAFTRHLVKADSERREDIGAESE